MKILIRTILILHVSEYFTKMFDKISENSMLMENTFNDAVTVLDKENTPTITDDSIRSENEIISDLICEVIGTALKSFEKNSIDFEKIKDMYNLTPRQTEIIRYLYKGFSNEEIGKILNIKLPTVKSHLTNIYNIVGVDSRVHLIFKVLNL